MLPDGLPNEEDAKEAFKLAESVVKRVNELLRE
jgi:HEPN domain-containing protein